MPKNLHRGAPLAVTVVTYELVLGFQPQRLKAAGKVVLQAAAALSGQSQL